MRISYVWLLTKVTVLVIGATNHIDGAVKATELKLTEQEIAYLEEPYVPRRLSGIMARKQRLKEIFSWQIVDNNIHSAAADHAFFPGKIIGHIDRYESIFSGGEHV